MKKLIETRAVHKVYLEFEKIKKDYPQMSQHFGKWQYWVSNGEKTLSIICLKKDKMLYKSDWWEVAEVERKTEPSVDVLERFISLKEAKVFARKWFKK